MRPMAKVFWGVDTRASAKNHSQGWFFMLEMDPPEGPFDNRDEAIVKLHAALKAKNLLRPVERATNPEG